MAALVFLEVEANPGFDLSLKGRFKVRKVGQCPTVGPDSFGVSTCK